MIFKQISEDKYLIRYKRKHTWNGFRIISGVSPNTYAEEFARRIYDSLYINPVNLIHEYKKYYKNEYDSLQLFLFWRHGIAEEHMKGVLNISHGYLSIIDFGIYRMNDDETVKSSIECLLQKLEF